MEGKKYQSEKEKDSQITNKMKAKIMLEELKLKYPNFNDIDLNDDYMIEKIIELNFNEEEIKNYFENYSVDKIYQELEDDYGISY